MRAAQLGRYSFVCADPLLICSGSDLTPIASPLPASIRSDLPPFQGGWAGLFSYELGHRFEKLPDCKTKDFAVPASVLGYYDTVLAFDHVTDKSWIVSQGDPRLPNHERTQFARARIDQLLQATQQPTAASTDAAVHPHTTIELDTRQLHHVRHSLLSNFSQAGYERAVERIVDYICAGDVFQVNLSQRLLAAYHRDPCELYLQLRKLTPATFGAFFDAGDFHVISASPERFLSITNGRVEARPIKGTRKMFGDALADHSAADELLQSPKERAENTMIVDLLRNDLSRVCEADSVEVPQLCELESYGYVHHLVSSIEGRLRPQISAEQLLAATFPGGSVTGAPKVRAMEIITELEQVPRGAYCGALGYVSASGDIDLSILIRTATLAGGWLQIPVGGGVVSASDPAAEYEETWAKAEPFLRVL